MVKKGKLSFFFTLRTMFYLPFIFIFLLIHNFSYFPSSIFFSLLHNFIIFSPPPPPHLLYIFFHPQKNRPHVDPTTTLDSTLFFNTAE